MPSFPQKDDFPHYQQRSSSQAQLPQIVVPKSQVNNQIKKNASVKDLQFEFMGDYNSSGPQMSMTVHTKEQMKSTKIIQNMKSLNDYMEKRFPIGVNSSTSAIDPNKNYLKTLSYQQKQQSQQNKNIRDQYGEIYKNLIKPQGGKFVDRMTGKTNEEVVGNIIATADDVQRRNSSLFTLDGGPLQSKYQSRMNPIDQLQTAKTSFINMINVLSNNPINSDHEKIPTKAVVVTQEQRADGMVPNAEEMALLALANSNTTIRGAENGFEAESPFILRKDSKGAIMAQDISAIEEYKKKFIDNSVSNSLKNLSFDKPASVYRNYLKEQGQKTLDNFQKTISSLNNQVTTVKERIAFKNHVKMFNEDSIAMDHISQEVPSTMLSAQKGRKQTKAQTTQNSQKNSSKKKKERETGESKPILLNCFKNLEHEFGREDIQTFERIIQDLISGKISVQDLLPKNELDQIMSEKFYAGFSLSQEVISTYKEALEDEYGLNIDELQQHIDDKRYFKNVNKAYKDYLKRYRDSLKDIVSLRNKQQSSNDYTSILEQFKKLKVLKKETKGSEIKYLLEQDGNDSVSLPLGTQRGHERYTAFILYMAIQEMVKQVFLECKEKGKLFWKLFRKYFEEQEKSWFGIIQDLTDQIKVLKKDRAFLLNKYVDKNNSDVEKLFIKDSIEQVVDNKLVTEKNLADHKRLIMELIGFVNREEDERYLMEVDKRNLEKDVKDIIHQWDLVRANMEFKNRIKAVNTQKIKEDFNLMEEVRQMKKDDLAILVNLERMRAALSNGGTVQWDLEKIHLQGQNHFYKEENHIMKKEITRLREQTEQNQEQLQELSKENFELTQRLKKFTSNMEIVEQIAIQIQTDVSFKNEEFTTSLDQILKNKLNNKLKKISKLMNKAKANVNHYQPMSQQEMMDLIQGIYIKKSQEINTKNELHKEFDDFVYSVLIQRFGTKKKADQKGQEFLLAIKKYGKEDERVEFFKKFLGFEEQRPYSREVLEFYILLIKTTNETIQNIMSCVSEGSTQTPCEKIFIEFSAAFDKYCKVFNNSSANLKEELKKHLIFDSDLIIENQPRVEVKLNEKWELFAIHMFLKNVMQQSITSANVEQAIIEKFGINEDINVDCAISFEKFKTFFSDTVGQIDSQIFFQVIEKEYFFKKYFGVLLVKPEDAPENSVEMIKMRGIRKLFRDRYDFKITLRKFLDLGMKMSIRFSDEAKEYYGKVFKVFDEDGDGFISFKEFRKIIKKVDPLRSDWKIHAIFQKATGVENSDKGELKFDEFIKCAMNNVLMEQMIDWEKVLTEDKLEKQAEALVHSYSQQLEVIRLPKRSKQSSTLLKYAVSKTLNLSSPASQSGRSRHTSASKLKLSLQS